MSPGMCTSQGRMRFLLPEASTLGPACALKCSDARPILEEMRQNCGPTGPDPASDRRPGCVRMRAMGGRWERGNEEGPGPARGSLQREANRVYQLARAAVTGCQRQGGLIITYFSLHSSGGWRSEMWFMLRAPSWLADSHLLTVSSCDLSSVCTRGGLETSVSPLRTPV